MTAEELVALRKSLELTQVEMAELMGMKMRAYHEIEGGRSPEREIHRLAAASVRHDALKIAKAIIGVLNPASMRRRAWRNSADLIRRQCLVATGSSAASRGDDLNHGSRIRASIKSLKASAVPLNPEDVIQALNRIAGELYRR